MREVRCPVQRIHVPAKLPVEPLPSSLFAEDAVFGESLAQPRSDQLLNRAVGHGHQVHIAFVFGLHARGKELAQARTGLARNFRCARNHHRKLRIGLLHSAAQWPASCDGGAGSEILGVFLRPASLMVLI